MLASKICMLADNISNTEWLVDTGVSDRIFSNLSMFPTYKLVTGAFEFIVVLDGRKFSILQVGSVKVKDMVLHKFLHILLF